jgi:hypothetical protein
MDRKIRWASLVALVTSGLAVLVAFGVDVSEEQRDALLKFLAAAGPLIATFVGWITHSSITDPSVDIEVVRAQKSNR